MSGGGAARVPALSQRERESNLGALAGERGAPTPALPQRERESDMGALAGERGALTPALSQRERESGLRAAARAPALSRYRGPVGSRFRGNDVAHARAWGGAARRMDSRLRGNDGRMSNSLSLWERAGVRVARRREATLLSRVTATSFPRRREPTAPHTATP